MDMLIVDVPEIESMKVSKRSSKYPFYDDFSLGSKLLFLLSVFDSDKPFFFSRITMFGKNPEIKRGQYHVRVEGSEWGEFQYLDSLKKLTIWKDIPREQTRELVEFSCEDFIKSEKQRIIDKSMEIKMLMKVIENFDMSTKGEDDEHDPEQKAKVVEVINRNIQEISSLNEARVSNRAVARREVKHRRSLFSS